MKHIATMIGAVLFASTFAGAGFAASASTDNATAQPPAASANPSVSANGTQPGMMTNQNGSQTNNQTAANASGSMANMQKMMRSNLEKAGFSDVKIMPESFLVRAKDPQGNPVMMVINPDSFEAVTTIAPNNGAKGGNGNAATANQNTNHTSVQ
jgi:hypothetical protein